MGKTAQAQMELQKSIDVTPEMAGLLIEELKSAGVEYVVAPYEADSQLAYLEKTGTIDGVLSEDSDLLVFGVRVLLTKLDQYGECIMIRRDDFTACREVSLVGWTDVDFRSMAILSGCDYLANIEKMGLKTAYRNIRKHKTVENVIRALQFDGKFKVPATYLEDFKRAEMTFMYQWAYCPTAKGLVNVCKPEKGVDPHQLPYIGQYIEPFIARGVASGALHPHTKEPLILPQFDTPSRNALTRQQQTPLQLSDQMKNKSIDSFFKPKNRLPLAELDPNMFTPSPAQQEAMRRASGASWPATPTPVLQAGRPNQPAFTGSARRGASDSWMHIAGSGLRSRDTPTESDGLRRAMAGSPAGFEQSSEFRSVKRARLCDEESTPLHSKDVRVESGQSKFFAAPAPARKGNPSTDLWSDDSLDEALMGLPDLTTLSSTATRRNKRIAIFADEDLPAESELTLTHDESQSTVMINESSVDLNQQDAMATPASSVDSCAFGSQRKRGLASSLAAKFTYSAEKSREKPSGKLDTRTGLEEIATEAIVVPRSDPIEPSDDELPTEPLVTVGKEPPALDTLSRGDALPSSMAAVKGSEDLLLSESEDEDIASPKAARKVFNLSRFAFISQR